MEAFIAGINIIKAAVTARMLLIQSHFYKKSEKSRLNINFVKTIPVVNSLQSTKATEIKVSKYILTTVFN